MTQSNMIQTEFSRRAALILVAVCALLGPRHRNLNAQENEWTVLRGEILNQKSQPIPNARVDISTAAPKTGRSVFCPSCYLDCQKWAKTDPAGRFEIDSLDTTLKFRLVISATGYKTMQTESIAPDGSQHLFKLSERPETIDFQRVVRGVIVNEYGLPIEGAVIMTVATINDQGLRTFAANGVSPAVSDSKGHFEVDMVDGVFGIDVQVTAEGLCTKEFIDLGPGDEHKELSLSEGTHVVGAVERNGRPVSGMTISVAQTDRSSRGEKFFLKAIPAVTDAQGRFELKNLLPDQEYCVYSVIGEANRTSSASIVKTQTFDAPSSGKTVDIGNLSPTQPVSFSGRLSLREGTPLEDVFLLFKRDPAWDLIKIQVADDGTFQIDGLPPEVYEIRLSSKLYELDADKLDSLLWTEQSMKRLIDKSTVDFVLPIRRIKRARPDLEPNGTQTLTGRVTTNGVEGLAGLSVNASDSVQALGKGLGNGKAPWTSTSQDGHFTLADLPDIRVWLKLYRPDEDGMRFWYLGMVKPNLNAKDITISLGPESTYALGTLSGQIK